MLKFWGTVLALLAAAAYGIHRVDAAQSRHAAILECRELELLDLTGQWARELGVQYDQLALACTMPWEGYAGRCTFFAGAHGERIAQIWIKPSPDYPLEFILIHEMVHLADMSRPEEAVESEAIRLWRAGRPWLKPATTLRAPTREDPR